MDGEVDRCMGVGAHRTSTNQVLGPYLAEFIYEKEPSFSSSNFFIRFEFSIIFKSLRISLFQPEN